MVGQTTFAIPGLECHRVLPRRLPGELRGTHLPSVSPSLLSPFYENFHCIYLPQETSGWEWGRQPRGCLGRCLSTQGNESSFNTKAPSVDFIKRILPQISNNLASWYSKSGPQFWCMIVWPNELCSVFTDASYILSNKWGNVGQKQAKGGNKGGKCVKKEIPACSARRAPAIKGIILHNS